MAKIRRIDFSPDEWLAGTRNLTFDERGAYWDVCALIYSQGAPIADDEARLSKALACHVRTWRDLRKRLLAKGKLSLGDGKLSNGRALREIVRAESRLSHSRAAAEGSARARRERAENEALSNDYNDIPEAGAPISCRAITNEQRSTLEEKKITPTESLGAVRSPKARASRSAPKKGERLPEGWRPDESLRQWTLDAIRKASSGDAPAAVNAGRELERFCDHWRAQPAAKGRKADWSATWRNWIRRAIDMEGSNGRTQRGKASGHASGSAPTVADGIAAAFARRSVPPRG